MCPACLTTLAIIAGGATSAGGVAAFVGKRLLSKKIGEKNAVPTTQQKGNSHGIQTEEDRTESSEGRVAS